MTSWELSVPATEFVSDSQLVISGPNKRVYWFLFVRLKEPKYGKDIPRYTKGDEAAFREQWADHRITERVTFGQLFENRLSSTLTPLHEVVYKNWWYKRIFLLGDAVHKPNPIGGQGANAAFETAAEFVNALLDKRDERPSGLSGLADDDIADILGKAREAREERARYIVKAAHDRQALLAFEKPLVSEIVCRVLLPWLGEDATYSRPQDIFVGGSRVKRLPMPLRPRATPYADELPSKPAGRVVARAGSRAFMVVLLAILVVVLKLLVPDFLPVFASSRSPPPLVFEDAPQRAHRFLLLSSLISPLLIYTIEGYRYGNHGSPLALPSVFNTAMSLTGRRVPVEVANSLIPALVFGFIIPSVVATKLDWGFGRMQSWQMLFCLGPTIFTGLTLIFSRAIRSWQARRNSSASAATVKRPEKNPSTARTPRFDVFAKTDLPHLRRAYKVAMVLQAASHLATVYYLRHINASFRAVLLGVDDQTTPRADAYLRWNLLLSFGAIAVYNLYVVFDLWARGFTTTERRSGPRWESRPASSSWGRALPGPACGIGARGFWRACLLGNKSDAASS
ncbi:hypothetical protein F4778DRAFT_803050 [Xylariomycetidae sp. FL2044]|nr:hypothetical protein F4778DRAFT_803050 [Xylariomycetidae sp. FL2044]